MRRGASVALALAHRLVLPSRSPMRSRVARAAGSGAEITPPVILSIEDDRASTRGRPRRPARGAPRPPPSPPFSALGRLERRDVITDLLPYLARRPRAASRRRRSACASRAGARRRAPRSAGASRARRPARGRRFCELPSQCRGPHPDRRALGRLPYEEVESFKSAETFLRKVLERPFPALADEPHVGAARALESMARLKRKIATLDEDTVARLRIVARTLERSRASSSATRWRRSSRRRVSTPRRSRSCSRATTTRSAGSPSWRSPAPARRLTTRTASATSARRSPTLRTWCGSKPCERGPAAASRSTAASRSSMRSTTRASTSSSARSTRSAMSAATTSDHQPDGVGIAHAAAAGTVAARSACLCGAGQARPRAGRDRHADVRHASDLAGADVRRPSRRDRRRRPRC